MIRLGHRRAWLLAAWLAVAVTGCAPKTAVVTAPAVPKHPDFVFPAPVLAPPAAVLANHEAAWNLLQGGDARAAERRYGALLKQAPDFYPAHAGLGYVALSRDDHKAALNQFDSALEANGSYAPALAGKGQTYLAMDQRDQALANFDAALAADPGLTAIRSAADVLRFQGLQGGVAGARRAAEAGRLAEARTAYVAAIAASPQSPFLYRELAVVERRDNQLPAARERIEQAIALEPNDARNYLVLADILEAMGETERAVAALTSAAALEPTEATTDRIEALRERLAFEAMPPEFRAIGDAESINRAQLAALIGTRLDALVKRAPRRNTAVITDTRGNWAALWILPVARAGLMEVYPNHTFQPSATVRRGDLAFTASQVLGQIAGENPRLAAAWRGARLKFPDLPPGHLLHPAASMAVQAGVMQTVENGAFHAARPVSGAEAIAAITRLDELAGRRR